MEAERSSYQRIIKSSSLIGGAQGMNVLIGMVRVKCVAVLLGPVGLGLLGMYNTILNFARTLAGLGISQSGVREVAAAFGSGDEAAVARTVLTLRRMCWITGFSGAVLLAALSGILSQLAFQSSEHAHEIGALGLALFIGNLAAAQTAIIRGARRIADMARVTVIGAIMGTVAAVGIYYWLGVQGIVPALIAVAGFNLIIANRFAAKIPIAKASMTLAESFRDAGGLIRLGIALMWGALLTAMVALAIRAMITQQLDLYAVGIYAAAFGLSGKFVDFILQAMGADYYPSLTAVSHDDEKMRNLVNMQSEVGILLSLPLLMLILSAAPLLISIFYSSEFMPAGELLRWFALGCLVRVVSWPMGFVVLAKGKAALFAGLQTAFNVMHISFVALGLYVFGLIGAAYAFFMVFVIHTVCLALIAYWLIRFRWVRGVIRLLFFMVVTGVIGFSLSAYLQPIFAALFGGSFSLVLGVCCLRGLYGRLGSVASIQGAIQRIPGLRYLFPEPTQIK